VIVEEPETFEHSESQSIDVTEQLLQQLNDMDAENDPPLEESAPPEITRNPFDEPFESEEIVLDQYSTFESLLLAEAPRVVNRTDTAFAQQLQQMEITETVVATTEVLTTNPETLTVADGPEPAAVSRCGEVLIIDDNLESQPAVVEGQQFRQLFSSLESAAGAPRFG
jgi:hypothetical protein